LATPNYGYEKRQKELAKKKKKEEKLKSKADRKPDDGTANDAAELAASDDSVSPSAADGSAAQ
jgi:hypothetical protein